jgi:phage-related tail fiber protein
MTVTTIQNGNTLLTTGFFPPCRAATTGSNIVLSGLQTIDGVSLIAGDRVLVKDQTDKTTNGIYTPATGNWVRTTDAQSNAQFFDGMAVVVAAGAMNGQSAWLCTCTDDPVILGTSLLTFAVFAAFSLPSGQSAPRVVTTPGALTINVNDSLVLIEAAVTSISLPDGAAKNGPVTIADATGNFTANNCTVTVATSKTISGQSSLALVTSYQAVTLRPLASGAYVAQ